MVLAQPILKKLVIHFTTGSQTDQGKQNNPQ